MGASDHADRGPEGRLVDLGITLPEVPAPVAAYVPAVRYGPLVQTSGQLPLLEGELAYRGLLGEDLSLGDGVAAARLCLLNALAAVRSQVGSLNAVGRIVKITGYVAAGPAFTEHPQVINGASQLLREIFGESGDHARAAVGVASLPLGAAVEVDLLAEVRGR